MEQAEAVAKEEGGEGEEDFEPKTECLAAEKGMNRKEKRKAMKKMKRKQTRKEMALKEREEEEAILNDPQQLLKIRIMEQEEAERSERERKMFEDRERAWIEAMEKKQIQEEEEERRIKALEEEEELSRKQQVENGNEGNEDDDWEYVEEGPAEIIWQGNEITVKKKRVKVPKRITNQETRKEDSARPTSNPLPPQSEAFADHKTSSMSAQQLIDNVAEQVPHFGTEQDKAHCPFHLKTGACRFGQRCSRVHFYPDKSSTLLIKNMYNGPGLAWEQDEVLEHTDEEVERCYEEFYEDVHTEFLKFGEIINFKVCRNGSFHLRGNVYIHYKSLDSAVLAHQSINGRYFAGKQISCDFINVTRWKVAICGEYMKSRYKTCSHGTACNFIHCFHNPGGDYEWADSDRPPPKYWVRKMVALFGYSDADEKQMAEENFGQPRNSTKMTMAHSERAAVKKRHGFQGRYGLRRSRSRERDSSSFTASGRRYEDENDMLKGAGCPRRTGDDKHGGKTLDKHEYLYEQNKNFKYHQRKSRKWDTESDVELLDRKMDRDRHHGHTRKSSKRRSRDHKNKTHETESDEDLSDGENKNDEVDWSDRDKAGYAYHENRRSSRLKRKVGCPDNHKDSKNRVRDTDGQWSDSNRTGDKQHHSRRKSSGQITKASKFSNDGNRTTTTTSCSTESSDDFLDNDAARHPLRARKRSKRLVEVSDISDDDCVPAQYLKHRHDHLSIEMGEADPVVKNLKSDGTHESSSLGQAAKRYRSHDFDIRCVSGVHTDNVERWEPEPASASKRKAGSSESFESGRPERYNGRDEPSDFHSELYYHDKVQEDGYESDRATHSKHRKSRRRSANSDRKLDSENRSQGSENRSRGSSQSSHRRHSSSVEEATDASEDNKDSGRKHEKHHAGHRSRDQKRHHTSRKLAT